MALIEFFAPSSIKGRSVVLISSKESSSNRSPKP